MAEGTQGEKSELKPNELKNLRGELSIILPFFLFSFYLFLGSFRYKPEARTVPMFIGISTAILTGMRLFHIIFPRSRIGRFKEAGLAGKFDNLKEEIEEEALKGKYEEEPTKEITSHDEKKAFIALIGSCGAFLLFGYLVGMFFVIVGTSYYYGYKQKGQLLMSLVFMYLIVYGVLYKLLGGPEYFGLVMDPILKSLHIIN
jgi:hypothetical protein